MQRVVKSWPAPVSRLRFVLCEQNRVGWGTKLRLLHATGWRVRHAPALPAIAPYAAHKSLPRRPGWGLLDGRDRALQPLIGPQPKRSGNAIVPATRTDALWLVEEGRPECRAHYSSSASTVR